MKLRAIKIERRFVPDFNGNKTLPQGEQIIIHFNRIPGTSEKANYKNFKWESGGAIQLVYNDNLLVSSLVSRVDNLELDTGEKIKDGKDLATANCPALGDLFTEIRNYLFPDDEEITEGE